MQRGAGFPRGPETIYFPPFFSCFVTLRMFSLCLNQAPICMCFLSDWGLEKGHETELLSVSKARDAVA